MHKKTVTKRLVKRLLKGKQRLQLSNQVVKHFIIRWPLCERYVKQSISCVRLTAQGQLLQNKRSEWWKTMETNMETLRVNEFPWKRYFSVKKAPSGVVSPTRLGGLLMRNRHTRRWLRIAVRGRARGWTVHNLRRLITDDSSLRWASVWGAKLPHVSCVHHHRAGRRRPADGS